MAETQLVMVLVVSWITKTGEGVQALLPADLPLGFQPKAKRCDLGMNVMLAFRQDQKGHEECLAAATALSREGFFVEPICDLQL